MTLLIDTPPRRASLAPRHCWRWLRDKFAGHSLATRERAALDRLAGTAPHLLADIGAARDSTPRELEARGGPVTHGCRPCSRGDGVSAD
ncbi:hypothetical protein [Roseisalinus antarcticus]|uniref:DUF1127 domain-containing protein n=1 Tax=Roseisalinus antarcticus TaxID=254357 RepID=A0A1Y5SJI4_9RHOB|nr:hypothetical protein [Roseisalinus antarcticus]SLN40561.1 hypothetical protein ROA7023_01590 [Roseisalinus antarcticus]